MTAILIIIGLVVYAFLAVIASIVIIAATMSNRRVRR